MNRKMMLAVLLAAVVAATGAFASGKKEDKAPQQGPSFSGPGPYGGPGCGGGWGPGRQGRGPGGRGYGRQMPRGGWDQDDWLKFSEEKVTVTGPLYFERRMHAEVKADGKTYELMVPRFYLYDLDLKEGQNVTVEGYVAAGEDENYLWVTKAVIDGKEYDLERRGRGPMMGPWGGRRGWR
jgi:hypothetical protein